MVKAADVTIFAEQYKMIVTEIYVDSIGCSELHVSATLIHIRFESCVFSEVAPLKCSMSTSYTL